MLKKKWNKLKKKEKKGNIYTHAQGGNQKIWYIKQNPIYILYIYQNTDKSNIYINIKNMKVKQNTNIKIIWTKIPRNTQEKGLPNEEVWPRRRQGKGPTVQAVGQ